MRFRRILYTDSLMWVTTTFVSSSRSSPLLCWYTSHSRNFTDLVTGCETVELCWCLMVTGMYYSVSYRISVVHIRDTCPGDNLDNCLGILYLLLVRVTSPLLSFLSPVCITLKRGFLRFLPYGLKPWGYGNVPFLKLFLLQQLFSWRLRNLGKGRRRKK